MKHTSTLLLALLVYTACVGQVIYYFEVYIAS